MKSIAIVTDSIYRKNRKSNLGNILKNNILEVFADNIAVKNYYFDMLEKDTIMDEDLVIVMAGSRALKVKKHVKNQNDIIVTTRTFLKSSVYPIFAIPDNSDVLIVNNALETVLESVSALYHIGIRHVNLIPFEQGKDYHGIDYAISPSEPELVPEYIKNIYDVGDRVIDISTMLLIISKLEINDKDTQKRLYNYYQKVFSSNDGIIDSYNTLLSKTEELDFLLDLSHEGILLTDESGKIIVANKKFKELFDIDEVIVDKFLHHLIPEINFSKYYVKGFQDDLINYKKIYINLEKQNIVHFNQEIRMYFTFQEVTYIKKLEQNLSQKLRQKGQIARYSFDDIAYMSLEDLASFIAEKSKNHFSNPEDIAQNIQNAARNSYRLDKLAYDPITLALSSSLALIKTYQKELKAIDNAIMKVMKGLQKNAFSSLTSIPGIGPVFAAGIIAEIGDINCFDCNDALAKYAGITWSRNDSGAFQSDDTRLTKRGNKYLRYYFMEAANSVRRYDPEYRDYYLSKFNEVHTHQHRRAISLTSRKLIRLIFCLLGNNSQYNPNYSIK